MTDNKNEEFPIVVKVNSKPDNCTVNATPGTTTLKGGESTDIAFSITPSGASEGSDWEKIELSIESAEGAVLPATLYYYCRVKTGKIEASVASIKTTMVKGESRDYPFTITNVGKGETGKISLALPSWISSVTPMEMPSLANSHSRHEGCSSLCQAQLAVHPLLPSNQDSKSQRRQ